MLSTPAKRLYAVIALSAVVYVAVHLAVGAYLVGASGWRGSWFTAGLAATTIATAVLGALHVAQLVVYAVVTLARRGRPFAKLPPAIADDDLPAVLVQIPGRNEPLDAMHVP
jgi:hypothetical protein